MPDTEMPDLPDDMFLIEVRDEETGSSLTTLSVSQTPTMLLSYAANRFDDVASNYFKKRYSLGGVDWRMIFMLAGQPGSTAAYASSTIGIDKGAISRCLQRLEENGLTFAGPLHANGRSRSWHLTEKGRALHAELLQVALDRQRRLLKGFAPAEAQAFCNMLERFLDNLSRVTD